MRCVNGTMALGLALPLILVARAGALDTPNERVSLDGLTGVHVVVEDVGAEAERQGLTRVGIQAEVEQRLRKGGLRVLTAAEALASVGRPTLDIRVTLFKPREAPQLYVYSIDLTLRQQIRLVRERSIESFAITWSENRDVGAVPAARLSVVRDAVRAKLDQFIRAWQTVNADR